ncbi:hypothetical protein JW930_03180 [Candidatus Woesearchaeota archaeon]|nr:hypothetical protein [Candidatus Woesearchaeota archaeon]
MFKNEYYIKQARVWSLSVLLLFILTAFYENAFSSFFSSPSVTGMMVTSSIIRETATLSMHAFGVTISILLVIVCAFLYFFLSAKLD